MAAAPTFDELVAEGAAEPVAGWDFSWFDGRATEERPLWGYSRLLAQRMRHARAALDIQTGGGEVLGQVPDPPPVLVATESWRPNIDVARRNLRRVRARVVEAGVPAELVYGKQVVVMKVSAVALSTPSLVSTPSPSSNSSSASRMCSVPM